MNSVIIFPANKIERNLIFQSRKAFSKSENIRSMALELTLWQRKSSDSEKAFRNWTNVYRFSVMGISVLLGSSLMAEFEAWAIRVG